LPGGAAELAIDRHQVQQGAAGAQLHQADVVLPLFQAAAQAVAVEAQHRPQVLHAQHQVVEFADVDRHAFSALPMARARTA
jgi:hypothetical protein